MDLAGYRDLFPITREYAYLNTAAIAPMPVPVARAIQEQLEVTLRAPLPVELVVDLPEEVRALAARLLNAARPDEIVQIPGTATGINIAAQSLPLRPGDNVLVIDGDYPAVIYPWLNLAPRGVLTKVVPAVNGGLDLDILASRVDAHTRAVSISTVMFATGFRNDIAALGHFCRERDIVLVVDAIQSLGYLPVDVQAWGADVVAAGSHKWLMGPPGSGLLYVRHELMDRLQLGPYVGADSVVDHFSYLDYNFTLLPDAGRFATTLIPYPAAAAMRASLSLLLEAGIDRIARHVLALTRLAADDLQSRGFEVISDLREEHRSGLLIVRVPDPMAAVEQLERERIIVSPRGEGIRLSPAFFNTEEEICRVGEVLGAR